MRPADYFKINGNRWDFNISSEQKLDNLVLYVDFCDNDEDKPIIFLKDGSVLILFQLDGIDYEGLGEEEKEQLSYYVKNALEQLGKGFSLSNLLIRTRSPRCRLKAGTGAPEIIQFMQSRNQAYWDHVAKSSLSNYIYCSLGYQNPTKFPKDINTLMKPHGTISIMIRELQENCRELLKGYASMKATLSRFGFCDLSREESFNTLYQIMNDADPPVYRDDIPLNIQLCHSNIRFNEKNHSINIDDRFFTNSIALKYPPPSTIAFYFRRMFDLPFQLILKNSFRVINYEKFEKKLLFNQNIAQAISAKSKNASNYVEEVSGFQSKVSTDREIPIHWSSYIYLKADSPEELARNTYVIKNLLKEIGSQGKEEKKNHKNAYFFLYPGHEKINRRTFPIVSSNGGDVFSAYNLNPGDRECNDFFMNRNGGTYGYDHFSKKQNAHHLLITGSTGSGKSVHANRMILTSLIDDPIIFVIDLSKSFNPLFELLREELPDDTAIMEITPQKTDFRFNPFLPDHRDNGSRVPERQMLFCEGLLGIMIGKNILHEGNKIIIRESLIDFFKQYRSLINNTTGPAPPPLDLLIDIIESKSPTADVANALKLWTYGRKGKLFNSGEDSLKKAKYVLFDLEDIETDEREMSAIIFSIFDKIYRDVSEEKIRNTKKYLYMDEAHRYLKIPQFAFWIEFFNRVGRHFRLKDIIISQGISDIDREAEWSDGIMNNLKEAMFFGGQKNVNKSFKKLNMTDHHIDMYYKLNKGKREFFFWTDSGSRRILNAKIPGEMLWLATSDPEERQIRNRIQTLLSGDMQTTIDTICRLTRNCHTKKEGMAVLKKFINKKSLHEKNQKEKYPCIEL